MIFVNFKTYEQGTGERAVRLAEVCRQVSREIGVEIIPLVQAADVRMLAEKGFEPWAQHVDAIDYGAHTGQILPKALVEAGAVGVMLNHSEKRVETSEIGKIIGRVREASNRYNGTEVQRFKVLVCSETIEEAKIVEKFSPDYIAYEPPELIGSKTTSVAVAKPEVIKNLVGQIGIPFLVGAGVHSADDVRIALELGAKGVLVASDVVLADDPERELRELAGAFKNQPGK